MMFKIDNFRVDDNLMYLIQQWTKLPTGDILSYFNHMALEVAETYAAQKPKVRINKQLDWHYIGTPIPYRMHVYSSWLERDQDMIRKIYVSVGFPTRKSNLDVTEIMDRIAEAGLGLEGSEALPNFDKPKKKVPIGLKKTIHE